METRHPLVVVPNRNIGDHLCSIFNIPKKYMRSTSMSLYGLGSESTIMFYIEGWESKLSEFERIKETIEISKMHGAIIIRVPEIQRIDR